MARRNSLTICMYLGLPHCTLPQATEHQPDLSAKAAQHEEEHGESDGEQVWPRSKYDFNDIHNSMLHRRVYATKAINTVDADGSFKARKASIIGKLKEASVFSLRAMVHSDMGTRWALRDLKRMQSDFGDLAHRYQVYLSLFLIHELKKGDESPYKQYIEVLPRRFFHPLVWDEQVLVELQASPLVSTVKAARTLLNDDYHKLTQLFTVCWCHCTTCFWQRSLQCRFTLTM
jgi:hypothetical protein